MFLRHEKAPHGLWTEITVALRAHWRCVGGVIVCRDITELKEEEFFVPTKSGPRMIAADAPLRMF
ncbi:MAG: hypothetical protein Udaeo2_34480 [Candidatus Udaeobacter sp.]|nr:MAG: hypothetical protein Udaeo2_34480 [Candidatus Udaeobacter sp.]